MAVVTQHVLATPQEVFDVLSNGWCYPSWVVGASHVRAVEPDWPAVGTRIHHSSGVWPVLLNDETRVESSEPPNRLVLLARGRPWGEARVALTMSEQDGGTLVTLEEEPVSGPGAWAHNRLSEALLKARNVEALARLAAMSERRTEPTG
jgi:polyketide cyclase/dehydrase/lipid transport protein